MSKIHPTASIDPSAQLAESVEVGAYVVVEADVKVGEGTVLRPHCVIRRYTNIGAGNYVDSFACLGGEPQDLKFDSETVSYLCIGNYNVFREGVTISRATGNDAETKVGSNTYWMANSHAGHNSEIHDGVILTNGALVAGHTILEKGVILAGNTAVHQFCWVGRKTIFQGGARVSMHVPPYTICSGQNNVISLNAVGLRRSQEFSTEDRRQIKKAFDLTYRSGHSPQQALEEMDRYTNWGEAVGCFRQFLRQVIQAKAPYNRGLCPHLPRRSGRQE